MKLIFLHIPKAGGTTFHRILGRLYKGSAIFSIKVRGHHLGVEEFTSLSDEKKDKIAVLKGHMPFGLHTHFTNEKAKYITLFRDPADRIISHYEYVLRNPTHYLYDKVKGSGMSLLTYALSDLSAELDNHQCRSLLAEQNIGINNFTQQLYDQAIHNLQKHFISFGIIEEFDKSLLLFRKDLGWTQYPFYVKLNSRPEHEINPVSATVRAKIEERNYWDVRLYNWVKAEFNRRLREIPDLERELSVLRESSEEFKRGIDNGAGTGNQQRQRSFKSFVLSLFRR